MNVFGCCKPIISPDRRKELALASTEPPVSAPSFDAEMLRSKSESRILQPSATLTGKDRRSSNGTTARSLFEASAYRVAAHSSGSINQSAVADTDHGGLPDKFLEAYVAALKDGNIHWATALPIANIFDANARLITQDKKTFIGKADVLKRLDQGIEMLIKMAGKDAAVPEWTIKGPILTESKEHQYKCIIKRGVMKISFQLDFLIVGGKIAQLRNTRL